jgi:DNA-binding transcriptional ArsR family regulator
MPAQRQAADILTALGDASRRTILERLATGPQSVGDIAAQLPISRPAVSRHLRLLRSAGLVGLTRVGTRNFYGLDASGAEEVRAYLDRLWGDAATRFQLAARNVRPRQR